ncbi:MAG: hypothetical protein U0V70_19240 [Terriglobia bacterium]
MKKRKKGFSAVKQIKRLSRELLRPPKGKVLKSKKRQLLEEAVVRENEELIES